MTGTLYNKTNGAVEVACINTLGVLYIVENGETVNSVGDLKGQTIVTTGKGATPELKRQDPFPSHRISRCTIASAVEPEAMYLHFSCSMRTLPSLRPCRSLQTVWELSFPSRR